MAVRRESARWRPACGSRNLSNAAMGSFAKEKDLVSGSDGQDLKGISMAVLTDKYYFSLCRIQQEAAHEISFLSTNSLKLDVLMQSMSYEEITENDYLKLLQMNYDKYDKMDRRREKRYCLVKMQMVADAKKENINGPASRWWILHRLCARISCRFTSSGAARSSGSRK